MLSVLNEPVCVIIVFFLKTTYIYLRDRLCTVSEAVPLNQIWFEVLVHSQSHTVLTTFANRLSYRDPVPVDFMLDAVRY